VGLARSVYALYTDTKTKKLHQGDQKALAEDSSVNGLATIWRAPSKKKLVNLLICHDDLSHYHHFRTGPSGIRLVSKRGGIDVDIKAPEELLGTWSTSPLEPPQK
jgi:hypothetical protein